MPKRPPAIADEEQLPLAAVRFLRSIRLERERVPSFDEYPFSIPAIKALDDLALDPRVTFFIGDNGSGKSTLIEAIAVVTESRSTSSHTASRSSRS